jgi:hypothetical protein
MAEYDSNLIKPVEGLKNITGLSPVKHREERKRRQQLNQENDEKDESAQDQETLPEEQTGGDRNIDSNGIGIDYCA